MGKIDPRVDKYINNSASFARPILTHLRSLVHITCPDVEETIKWGFPNFEYKGPLCSMAAFKEHCAFGFWKAALMKDAHKLKQKSDEGMGHLGKIKSIADIPEDSLLGKYITEAIILNDDGIKLPARKKTTNSKELQIPEKLMFALKKNKNAKQTFDNFSPSHRKEYIEWINDAKTESTSEKRIQTTIEWLIEGKSRMWKYQSKIK